MRKLLCALLCFASVSCVRDRMETTDGTVVVRVSCVEDATLTRSCFDGDESGLDCFQVFVFEEDGSFATSLRSTEAGDLVLRRNVPYRFYAVGNMDDIADPESETDLESLRYRIASMSDLSPKGLPMSSPYVLERTFESGTAEVSIPLVRLVARYSLRIDRSALHHSAFEVDSVAVRQSALDVSLFGGSSAATVVGDFDSSSPSDAQKLNRGGTACFYMLENCRGVLLPGNADQWRKVPDNIASEAGLCTYFEIRGRWSTEGVDSDIVCRLYPGRDNCSDSNIDRNTDNDVTLVLSDEGLLKSCWKVSRSNMDDRRRLEFESRRVEIVAGDPERKVLVVCDPPGQSYSVKVSPAQLSAAAMTFRRDGDTLFLSSAYEGDAAPEVFFSLQTWDGVPKGTLEAYVISRDWGMEGLAASYVLGKDRLLWPELSVKPYLPKSSQISIVSSDYSVLDWEWDEDDDEQPLCLKAVGAGFAWLDISFGKYSGRVYVYVPSDYEFTGLPEPYIVIDKGSVLPCTVRSFPANSIYDGVQVQSSEPAVASVSEVRQLYCEPFVYGGIGFRRIGSGCSFVLRGVSNGKSVLSVSEGLRRHLQKRNLYVLGPGSELDVKAVLSDGRGTVIESGRSDDEIRIGTENSHPMLVSFDADAIITKITLTDLDKKGWHPNRDTDDYYSVSADGVSYSIGDCCTNLDLITGGQLWQINGNDCDLFFEVTFGSNAAAATVMVRFASDYVAGDD